METNRKQRIPTKAAHNRAEAHVLMRDALLKAADGYWNRAVSTMVRTEAHRHDRMVREYRRRYGELAHY